MWQVTTVIWGAAFLWLVTFLLLQIITNVYLSRSGLWPTLRGHQPDFDALLCLLQQLGGV